MAAEMNDVQTVDLDRIRRFFDTMAQDNVYTHENLGTEAQALKPMVNELLDLVEGSTLLEDAAQARLDSMYQDKMSTDPSSTLGLKDIADIDPERILPSRY